MTRRILLLLLVALFEFSAVSNSAEAQMLLKATYTPNPGSDREYGQGAIERHELAHREIERNVWLVRVPDDDGAETWARRLTAATGDHGTFRVVAASAEECRRVDAGEITLQK